MSGPSVFYWILGSRPDASENSATSTEQDSKIRRSEIWFEDGNVILQAGHTQFRVHRGIIALHSRVFKGMFPFVLTDAHWSIFGYDLTTFQCGARCPSGAQVVQPGHYILLSSTGGNICVGLVATLPRPRNPTLSNTPARDNNYRAPGRARDGKCLVTGIQTQTFSRLKVVHIFPWVRDIEWVRKGYPSKITDTADEACMGGPIKSTRYRM